MMSYIAHKLSQGKITREPSQTCFDGKGHRAKVTGQRSQGKGHRAKATGQKSQGEGHRAKVTGQRSQGEAITRLLTGGSQTGEVEGGAEGGAIPDLVEVLGVGGQVGEHHSVQHRRGVVQGGGAAIAWDRQVVDLVVDLQCMSATQLELEPKNWQ